MKRLTCCLLALVICLAYIPASASSLKYLEYYKATDQMRGIFADFINELNEQFDEDGTLSDVEFALYFQYAEVFLDLREVSMLQSNAAYSDELESFNESTSMIDDLVRISLNDAFTRWENGEITTVDAINEVRPILEILIEAE